MKRSQSQCNKKIVGIDDVFFILGVVGIVPVILVGIYVTSRDAANTHLFPACPIYTYTGYSCPACGSTRAVVALFKGDICESIKQNVIIVFSVLEYIVFMSVYVIGKFIVKSHKEININVYVYLFLIVLVIQWLFKI